MGGKLGRGLGRMILKSTLNPLKSLLTNNLPEVSRSPSQPSQISRKSNNLNGLWTPGKPLATLSATLIATPPSPPAAEAPRQRPPVSFGRDFRIA